MSSLPPRSAVNLLEERDVLFLDVREADEFARSHVPGTKLSPLSGLSKGEVPETDGCRVVLLCQSGTRSEQARQILQSNGIQAQCIQGGIAAWRKAGLPVNENKAAPISVMRQVQIIAGSLILAGVLLGQFVNPGFYWLSAAVGAGLFIAGTTGTCMMAGILMHLPYNKS